MKIKFNKSEKICFKSINEYRSTFVKKFRHLVFFLVDRIEIYEPKTFIKYFSCYYESCIPVLNRSEKLRVWWF